MNEGEIRRSAALRATVGAELVLPVRRLPGISLVAQAVKP